MRKDAQRNRDAIVAAASAAMRSDDGDISMEAIAEHAGVTRGTLYRNFSDRQAMYGAVLERDLADLKARLAQTADPLAFIKEFAELTLVYDRFLAALYRMDDYDRSTMEARIVAAVLERPLARAQALGLLRPELTGGDLLTVCRMIGGNWHLDAAGDSQTVVEHRLALLMRGIGNDRA